MRSRRAVWASLAMVIVTLVLTLALVAVSLSDPGPVMCGGTGLESDQAGTLPAEELGKLATGQRRVTQLAVRRR